MQIELFRKQVNRWK